MVLIALLIALQRTDPPRTTVPVHLTTLPVHQYLYLCTVHQYLYLTMRVKNRYISMRVNACQEQVYQCVLMRVKNRYISKRETENLINELWNAREQERRAANRTGSTLCEFNDFIYNFLQMKYGKFQGIICETAYNLMDGCRRFNDDADVELFEKVCAIVMTCCDDVP